MESSERRGLALFFGGTFLTLLALAFPNMSRLVTVPSAIACLALGIFFLRPEIQRFACHRTSFKFALITIFLPIAAEVVALHFWPIATGPNIGLNKLAALSDAKPGLSPRPPAIAAQSNEHLTAHPAPSGRVAVDINGEVKNNVIHLRSFGYDTAVRAGPSATVEGNTFDVKAREDSGPLPDYQPIPIETREPPKYSEAQLERKVFSLSTALHDMQLKVNNNHENPADEVNRQLHDYLRRYDYELRDAEYILLCRLKITMYGRDRPVMLTDGLAAGIRPFDALGEYLQSLLTAGRAMNERHH